MADELFFQATTRIYARRFERRPGLLTRDASKSCGARFLSNLENAIFSRADDARAAGRAGEVSGLPFPRGGSLRG